MLCLIPIIHPNRDFWVINCFIDVDHAIWSMLIEFLNSLHFSAFSIICLALYLNLEYIMKKCPVQDLDSLTSKWWFLNNSSSKDWAFMPSLLFKHLDDKSKYIENMWYWDFSNFLLLIYSRMSKSFYTKKKKIVAKKVVINL